MVLTTISLLVIGGMAGKSATHAIDQILSSVEGYERESTHKIYGHTFVCKTNHEYHTVQSALTILERIAGITLRKMGWPEEDKNVVVSALLTGTILWGRCGSNLSAEIIQMLPEDMRVSATDVIQTAISQLHEVECQQLICLAHCAQ